MNSYLGIDPVEEAFSQINEARKFLIQWYNDPNIFDPVKKHIKERFAQKVQKIISAFKSNNIKLFKSTKMQHDVEIFGILPEITSWILRGSKRAYPLLLNMT